MPPRHWVGCYLLLSACLGCAFSSWAQNGLPPQQGAASGTAPQPLQQHRFSPHDIVAIRPSKVLAVIVLARIYAPELAPPRWIE